MRTVNDHLFKNLSVRHERKTSPSDDNQRLKLVIPDALLSTCTANTLNFSFRPKMSRIGIAFYDSPLLVYVLDCPSAPQFFIKQKKKQ